MDQCQCKNGSGGGALLMVRRPCMRKFSSVKYPVGIHLNVQRWDDAQWITSFSKQGYHYSYSFVVVNMHEGCWRRRPFYEGLLLAALTHLVEKQQRRRCYFFINLMQVFICADPTFSSRSHAVSQSSSFIIILTNKSEIKC